MNGGTIQQSIGVGVGVGMGVGVGVGIGVGESVGAGVGVAHGSGVVAGMAGWNTGWVVAQLLMTGAAPSGFMAATEPTRPKVASATTAIEATMARRSVEMECMSAPPGAAVCG